MLMMTVEFALKSFFNSACLVELMVKRASLTLQRAQDRRLM